jgi:hypothetical protein
LTIFVTTLTEKGEWREGGRTWAEESVRKSEEKDLRTFRKLRQQSDSSKPTTFYEQRERGG